MRSNFFYSVKERVKYWWVSPIIGIIAILLGIWCLANLGGALSIIAALFIAGFLVSGIFEIVYALSNKNNLRGWGWTLASSIIDILFAILLLAIPIGTIAILLFLVGFWVMFQSIWGIGMSIDLQKADIKGWGWTLAFSILALILSVILIANPVFAAGFIVYLLAFTLFTYGIMRIYYGIKMRDVHKDIEKMEGESKD